VEILILHPGALGDIILSLPALAVLRERLRTARLTLAANTDFSGAVASGYADRLLSLSSLPLYRLHGVESVPPEDERLWRSYDRILSWTGYREERFTARLVQMHPCILAADWKPVSGEQRHVSRLFIDSLRPWFPVPPETPIPEIRVDSVDCRHGHEWLQGQGWSEDKPLMAIHPGAGSTEKRWALHRFQELGQRLRTRGRLLVLEGPAEEGLGQELAAALGPDTCLARHLPLRLLAAVLRHCRLFVGNDSGIAHLAAGLGLPCVVLFGPTSPVNWAPVGRRIQVLRNTFGCLACEREPAALHTCLNNISVDTVWESALGVMEPRKGEVPLFRA
jgi:heptosyltransferase-3